MEIFMTQTPSTLLAPAGAATAALLAYPCASAHAATTFVDVQGFAVRAVDGVDATAGKRRTGADMGLGFAVATIPGSPAWSPPI